MGKGIALAGMAGATAWATMHGAHELIFIPMAVAMIVVAYAKF